MHTGTLDVRQIFGQERRHLVPLFQRPYVWNAEEQWDPLWEDLMAIVQRLLRRQETRPHFLGAIVLDQVPKPTGHIEVRLVIDGQQRLTTIQLLLTAFRDVCGSLGFDRHQRSLEKLTINDDPLKDEPDEVFKVWPTNADQASYRQVMLAGDPQTLCQRYGHKTKVPSLEHPVLDGYLFFHRRTHDWLVESEESRDARLEALYQAVREYLRLVVIDLGPEDDAQLIFETLNARGTPLLPSDLVKNHLFHRAQTRGIPLDPLYEQYWRPFDEDATYWRKELGRGHARRARIDTFLQFYLTVKLRDEVPVGHLYTAFRDRLVQLSDDPEVHFADLTLHGKVYQSFDQRLLAEEDARFFERLEVLGLASPYPFLMDLFLLLSEDEEQRRTVLRDVESFLVRRLFCQLTTRGYNRFFIDLLLQLHEGGRTPAERVRAFLLASKAESARWPSDEEFRAAWCSVPAFKVFTQNRIRMALEALECQMRTGKSEIITTGEKPTIEHLMPRKWRAHWPLPPQGDPIEVAAERDRLLDTMGNLTLVTRKLNSALSNGPWGAKLPDILFHSALALNRELTRHQSWGEESIQQRSDALFQHAVRIWPRPQEEPQQ